jgi:hypothetical protein
MGDLTFIFRLLACLNEFLRLKPGVLKSMILAPHRCCYRNARASFLYLGLRTENTCDSANQLILFPVKNQETFLAGSFYVSAARGSSRAMAASNCVLGTSSVFQPCIWIQLFLSSQVILNSFLNSSQNIDCHK